jgi:hypothetical protein
MVIDALTPEEIARHDRAIAKIRRKLFAQHTPSELEIVPDSERVLSATAQQRWCASIGNYRTITWGGLRFTLAIASSRYELTVSHCERDIFILHIANERGNTEVVSPVKFNELDRVAWKHIENLRRANGRSKRPDVRR